ncbi:Dityrosine transporter 1 [Candida viswanathii]|uniref:Dityrosine transporter 1 n=1 Tax=Candida viswanathii TaxID=5486 RepID=A0A367XZN2_9ASCO|nr:Dityrosine transporter 1 [Candida viswanathii]
MSQAKDQEIFEVPVKSNEKDEHTVDVERKESSSENNPDSIDESEKKDDIEKQQQQQPPEQPKEPYCALPLRRKSLVIAIVTLAGCLGPIAGNIYIPVLPQLQDEFSTSATTINGTVSVFMVVFAIAPLFWASWADYGGRKMLYLIPLLFFILANILLAAVPANIAALYILRILQALGASSVISVGAGTVSDIIEPKDRAKAISIFMWGPQLGPVLGPVLSIIASKGDWRWIFGFLALFGVLVYVIILFFLPETLRYLVGNSACYEGTPIYAKPQWRQKKIAEGYPIPPKPSLKNYWKILKYKPVLICSINGGLLFATFYGVSITFARVLRDQYSFTNAEVSVSYICPGISLIIGSTVGGWLSDKLRATMIRKRPDSYVPEHRFSLQLFGLIISMAGVLGYAWTVYKHVHVASVFIFTFLGGFGMTWVFVANTTYLTECSTGQPATNVAIGNFARNISATICTAIVEPLIEKMGFGWCLTGLALTDLAGIGLVIILLKYGPKWRREYEQSK